MTNEILDLRHLVTLKALKTTGSLTRAAGLLNLTQSALSHQIKLLEDTYGVTLFERKSSPLILTPPGERLLKLANEVIPLVEAAQRDLQRMSGRQAGTLRIAVECHTCFDWLMPVLFKFRPRWPDVEIDFVSGFHAHPTELLDQGKADLVILGDHTPQQALVFIPLFQSQILAVIPKDHPLKDKPYLCAEDFASETLLTYPVPDRMLDIVTQVLSPAGIYPERRTSELTNAILQLAASRRGIAALPIWTVAPYQDHHGLLLKPITPQGLTGKLYAGIRETDVHAPYIDDFIRTIREVTLATLPGIELL